MSRKVKKGEREVKKKADIWFLSLALEPDLTYIHYQM